MNEIKLNVSLRVRNDGADLTWTPQTFQYDQEFKGVYHQLLTISGSGSIGTDQTGFSVHQLMIVRYLEFIGEEMTGYVRIFPAGNTNYIAAQPGDVFITPRAATMYYEVSAEPAIVEVIAVDGSVS